MTTEEALREGRLADALAALQAKVRNDPTDARLRVFLFQLLSVLGSWERAFTQLKVAGELDSGALAMVQTYREALRCEMLRAGVFSGDTTPMVFGQPSQWVALLIEALHLTAQGNHAETAGLREQAFAQAPGTSGMIDGQAFDWIADADSRLGPVFEAIVNGAYYWVPFSSIREIRMEAPEDLRDMVWMPAQLVWPNGGGTVALIPARYPGSEASEDPAILMGRKTEWREPTPETYLGMGQKMLATNVGDHALMDVRSIVLETLGDGEAERPDG